MASSTLAAPPQPLATTSHSRQNHLNHSRNFSSTSGVFDGQESPSATRLDPDMSFSMSQGSQGNGLMVQPGGPFRQYDGSNGAINRNPAPQIYSAVYSGVDVYEMEVNGIAVMRRRKDSWLNATQILKVAGIEKGKRTKVLEKEILIGEHEKVQGGYGKYQGTWIKFERGLEFCRQYGVEELLRPLLTYDMGQDGGVAGRGGIDTPTKEQAMAAQRKRMYNSSAENRNMGQSGTFFKNISSTASHAVAAISKARFDSPVPRIRNNSTAARPASFSRQSSQQHLGSQESPFPGGSQQSMQSFASADSFTAAGTQESAYAPHFSQPDVRNGDFEEPPRKRMRPSPSVNESHSQQPLTDGYYDMSMREPSPTEPNDSFAYHAQNTQGVEDTSMPLGPLPNPTTKQGQAKKELLMSLFANPAQTDFSTHEAFATIRPEDLDMPIDKSFNTALIWAATLSRLHLLKELIARGASIHRVNRSGETALMRSCLVTNNLDKGTFPELLELLGSTLDFRDDRGRTVLHHIAITSAVKGRSQASKYYLESLLAFVVRQGLGPNSQQSFTNGPASLRSINIGRFMSEMVNIQDRSGDTALNIAARIGNRSIISQLLEVGADDKLRNRSNLCPNDFGVGERLEAEDQLDQPRSRTMGTDVKESSGEIITSITQLLSETEAEFNKEMESKQEAIDALHTALRDASGALGEERRKYEQVKEDEKQRKANKTKINNLTLAISEERAKLSQMQQQFGQMNGEVQMKPGDADEGFAIPAGALPANILSNINPGSRKLAVVDQAQRQLLSSVLPPLHVLRARVNAYKANNQELEDDIGALKGKNSDLEAKYRKLIALCTNTPEANVDSYMEGLLRAIESENDPDVTRVRDFLHRVQDGAEY